MFDFLDYKKEMVFATKVCIEKDKVNIEDFFNQLYISNNFHRWFAKKPVVDIVFYDKFFDVGCEAKFCFRFLPFSYRMRCVKVIKHKCIESEFYGKVSGGVKVDFIEHEDVIIMDHVLTIRGNTRLVHWYYLLACSVPHIPYMKLRLNVLKNEAIKDTKVRIQGH